MKDEFISKAKENITVAEWSYENGHYNASANRAYYAAFQAAIAALAHIGINTVSHSHKATQAHFVAELIKRRKIYPSHLKSYLKDLQDVRNDADYELKFVSKKIAGRQYRHAKEFVELIAQEIEK